MGTPEKSKKGGSIDYDPDGPRRGAGPLRRSDIYITPPVRPGSADFGADTGLSATGKRARRTGKPMRSLSSQEQAPSHRQEASGSARKRPAVPARAQQDPEKILLRLYALGVRNRNLTTYPEEVQQRIRAGIHTGRLPDLTGTESGVLDAIVAGRMAAPKDREGPTYQNLPIAAIRRAPIGVSLDDFKKPPRKMKDHGLLGKAAAFLNIPQTMKVSAQITNRLATQGNPKRMREVSNYLNEVYDPWIYGGDDAVAAAARASGESLPSALSGAAGAEFMGSLTNALTPAGPWKLLVPVMAGVGAAGGAAPVAALKMKIDRWASGEEEYKRYLAQLARDKEQHPVGVAIGSNALTLATQRPHFDDLAALPSFLKSVKGNAGLGAREALEQAFATKGGEAVRKGLDLRARSVASGIAGNEAQSLVGGQWMTPTDLLTTGLTSLVLPVGPLWNKAGQAGEGAAPHVTRAYTKTSQGYGKAKTATVDKVKQTTATVKAEAQKAKTTFSDNAKKTGQKVQDGVQRTRERIDEAANASSRWASEKTTLAKDSLATSWSSTKQATKDASAATTKKARETHEAALARIREIQERQKAARAKREEEQAPAPAPPAPISNVATPPVAPPAPGLTPSPEKVSPGSGEAKGTDIPPASPSLKEAPGVQEKPQDQPRKPVHSVENSQRLQEKVEKFVEAQQNVQRVTEKQAEKPSYDASAAARKGWETRRRNIAERARLEAEAAARLSGRRTKASAAPENAPQQKQKTSRSAESSQKLKAKVEKFVEAQQNVQRVTEKQKREKSAVRVAAGKKAHQTRLANEAKRQAAAAAALEQGPPAPPVQATSPKKGREKKNTQTSYYRPDISNRLRRLSQGAGLLYRLRSA